MNNRTLSGQLITLEGIDGAGKTSQLATVNRWLEKKKISYLNTCEPGGTPLGREIRALLTSKDYGDMDSYTELFLFFADRAQHIRQVIKPALAKGLWVVSDRFYDASYAYQGGGRQLSGDRIDALLQWTCREVKPDLTLLLDVDPEVVWRRNSQCQATLFDGQEQDHRFASSQMNKIEQNKRDFYTRVRTAYLQQAKREPERWRIIRAGRRQDTIAAEINGILDKMKWKQK